MNKISLIVLTSVALFVGAVALADDPPAKLTLKSLENLWSSVVFDHKLHVDAADTCKSCHHKPFGKVQKCEECHDEPVKKTDFNHESHWEYDDCISCHQTKSTKELACVSCHKDPYDPKQPGVVGLKGALHAQCMDCHKENGVANDCASCHKKKAK